MSSRALRRLREERESETEKTKDEEEFNTDDEDNTKSGGNFLAMIDESSSEEEDASSSDDDYNDSDDDVDGSDDNIVKDEEKVEAVKEEEDFDNILAEFEKHDLKDGTDQGDDEGSRKNQSSLFLSSLSLFNMFDVRDLDIDYVRRTTLMMGVGDNSDTLGTNGGGVAQRQPRGRSGGSQQMFLFGQPKDDWNNQRPPHYVGGGMGMNTYDTLMQKDNNGNSNNASHLSIPWPYNAEKESVDEVDTYKQDFLDTKNWYTFIRSNECKKDYDDFLTVQQSGDVNALALFIAHHPFVTDAILQLSIVLEQMPNQSQPSLDLLRRVLWVYECSSISSFFDNVVTTSKGNSIDGAKCRFMDYERIENTSYFNALFALIQMALRSGCNRTCLSCSQYLLALDPLRDPMSVLVIIDYFALSTNSKKNDKFLVDFINNDSKMQQPQHRQNKKLKMIHYLDPISEKHYKCDLTDMPNLAYSYALALYRLSINEEDYSEDDNSSISLRQRADDALKSAIEKFPSVVEELLQKNGDVVDLTGRSLTMDWQTVLANLRNRSICIADAHTGSSFNKKPKCSYYYSESNDDTSEHDNDVGFVDKSTQRVAYESYELIVRIFVAKNHKLWCSNDVLKWLHKNCTEIPLYDGSSTANDGSNIKFQLPSPALIKYKNCNPSDYDDTMTRNLPQDVNPLEPAYLQMALVIDPNRNRRFLRGQQRRRGGRNDEWEQQLEQIAALGAQRQGQGVLLFGSGGLNMLDPDLPLLELFWRSLLPWNHVDGVPPPRR